MARSFRAAYDNAAYTLGISFGSFCFTAAACYFIEKFIVGWWRLGAYLVSAYLMWLLFCGAAGYAWKYLQNEYPAQSETFKTIKNLWGPATALFFVDLIITAVLFGDTYILMVKVHSILRYGWIPFAWFGLLWLFMLIYHPALLSAQSLFESKPTPGVIIKKSFLLMADNTAFSFAHFVVILSVIVISTLLVFLGHALVCFGICAFMSAGAVREPLIRYGAVTEEPDEIIDPWEIKEPDKRSK